MSRITARDCAMRLLYGLSLGGCCNTETVMETLEEDRLTREDIAYIEEVMADIPGKYDELDAIIETHAEGWKPNRIAKVDLAILRLAIYEILYRADVPQKAAINEAVELAKTYGTENSAKFVNGVLGGYVRDLEMRTTS